MGSCVSSSHNKSSSFSDSALKLPALISKPDTISTTSSSFNNDVIYPSTINNNNGNPPPLDSAPPDSDEIMFFDSRGWLDSDCDDDFMSVDGEFTPSRGTTPVHHKFCDQTPPPEADDDEEPKHEQEPSPIDNNKKRLLELFKETQDDDQDQQDDVAEVKSRTCLWLRTRPITSSAPATPYNNNDRERQQLKRVRSAAHGGCVPRLVSCNSFTDRRRKLMTHLPTINVQR